MMCPKIFSIRLYPVFLLLLYELSNNILDIFDKLDINFNDRVNIKSIVKLLAGNN
jgi:hypothetical protein